MSHQISRNIRKLIISGSLVERLEFTLTDRKNYGKQSEEELEQRQRLREIYNIDTETPQTEVAESSVQRARSKIRRLIYTNAGQWKDKNGYIIPPKFYTLTLKENVTDLESANYYFTKYVQRINYQFTDVLAAPLKYICVPEFQKRGAVHYHATLFNFPFVNFAFKRLREAWGGYRIRLDTFKDQQSVASIAGYVSKYITKQATDPRFWGKKRYFISRDLIQPVVLRDDLAIELVLGSIGQFQVSRTDFETPHIGKIDYWSYYLGDGRGIDSVPLDAYAREQIELARKNPL